MQDFITIALFLLWLDYKVFSPHTDLDRNMAVIINITNLCLQDLTIFTLLLPRQMMQFSTYHRTEKKTLNLLFKKREN